MNVQYPMMNGRQKEYPITNSRSEAKTGFSMPKAMTLLMSTNIQCPRKDTAVGWNERCSCCFSTGLHPWLHSVGLSALMNIQPPQSGISKASRGGAFALVKHDL
jgi:hypothetical protein